MGSESAHHQGMSAGENGASGFLLLFLSLWLDKGADVQTPGLGRLGVLSHQHLLPPVTAPVHVQI